MAELSVRADELVVRLAWWEKAAARRGNVRVPLAAVEKVSVQPWWRALRGMPGRGLWMPGTLSVGVRELGGAQDFVVLRPRQGAAACIDLRPGSAPFARIAVSGPCPQATVATVRTARSRQECSRPAAAADPEPDDAPKNATGQPVFTPRPATVIATTGWPVFVRLASAATSRCW
ncbi:hypothetical protein [Streptomyces orinoci]|uniref:Uncharacterized protein n=1 Tax=Streptomyces orinoci TaxID=67339 RepID=A0ABV3JUR1_STRON|nr:hypothetical protein [Streptomyces orinoci]